jgi:hypothetical protein
MRWIASKSSCIENHAWTSPPSPTMRSWISEVIFAPRCTQNWRNQTVELSPTSADFEYIDRTAVDSKNYHSQKSFLQNVRVMNFLRVKNFYDRTNLYSICCTNGGTSTCSHLPTPPPPRQYMCRWLETLKRTTLLSGRQRCPFDSSKRPETLPLYGIVVSRRNGAKKRNIMY